MKIIVALYSVTKKNENFLNRKKYIKIKRGLAFKGFASTHNIKIFNSFKPKLQLGDTESTIKKKLIELLSELIRFKFEATSVLVFKKQKVKIKQSMTIFIPAQKQK